MTIAAILVHNYMLREVKVNKRKIEKANNEKKPLKYENDSEHKSIEELRAAHSADYDNWINNKIASIKPNAKA